MKKILITGADSYVGTNLAKWLARCRDKYFVDILDMKSESWKERDFSGFDVVFHVAAIVHKKETSDMVNIYFTVNRDLPIKVAKKARESGVKQFIFMSTMAVYGKNGKLDEEVIITRNTKPDPKTYYAKSKLEAENEINKLMCDNFKVIILRPPLIYGTNCPGNYAKLEKLAKNLCIFPMIENKRSMLHIDKLCYCLEKYINSETDGLFFPQDDEYINTSLLVKKIAEQNGKKIYLSSSLGWLIRKICKRVNLFNKVFGNLVYEK